MPPETQTPAEAGRKTIDDLLEEARARLRRLGPEEAAEAQARGALLVDTRSSDQRREQGVIPGSVHFARNVLEWRVDPVAPLYDARVGGVDREIVLVCAQGYSSSLAAATLQDLGFSRATDLVGGFEAWRDAGLPVEQAP